MEAKNKNQHSLGSSRNGKVHVGTRRLRHACFPSSSCSRDSLVAQESWIRDHYPATTVGQEYPFKFIKLSCCRNDSEFRVFYDCNTNTQPSDSTTTLKVNHLEWGPKQWKKGTRESRPSRCVCVLIKQQRTSVSPNGIHNSLVPPSSFHCSLDYCYYNEQIKTEKGNLDVDLHWKKKKKRFNFGKTLPFLTLFEQSSRAKRNKTSKFQN